MSPLAGKGATPARQASLTCGSGVSKPCSPPRQTSKEVAVLVISVVVPATRPEGTLDYAGVPNKPDRHPQLALLGRQPSAVANRRRGALITQYTP